MPETTPRKANTTGTATTPHAMRRARREVTDPAALRAIFEQAHVVRIGATDAEGMFVVPMNYCMEWGEGDAGGSDAGAVAATPPACTLWLHCAAEGRKVDAWRAEPHVAFELDVELGVIEGSYTCAYSFAYASVMGEGVMREATTRGEKLRGLAAIMEHMAPGAPVSFSDEAVGAVSVWRLDVSRMTGKRRGPARPVSDTCRA